MLTTSPQIVHMRLLQIPPDCLTWISSRTIPSVNTQVELNAPLRATVSPTGTKSAQPEVKMMSPQSLFKTFLVRMSCSEPQGRVRWLLPPPQSHPNARSLPCLLLPPLPIPPKPAASQIPASTPSGLVDLSVSSTNRHLPPSRPRLVSIRTVGNYHPTRPPRLAFSCCKACLNSPFSEND